MMTTFLYDHELRDFTSVQDKELNELFQEVREKFDNKYLIHERVFTTKKWFRKPISKTVYTLYNLLNKMGEVQVINFASDETKNSRNSMNYYVPKSYIMTYFYGVLTGIKYRIK